MFTITLRRQNGEEFQLQYDHRANRLLTMEGLDALPFYHEKREWSVARSFSPDNPVGKTGKVKNLKIQLGLKCNYSCAYCNQAVHVGSEVHTNLDDVHEFMAGLDSWMETAPQRIELWGGEPLVYWKKLKVLIPALHERFPQAQFVMITNGSLLDDEKFAFIERYDMAIAMSHDGPGQHLRGPDPFEQPETVRIVRRFIEERPHRFSINSVITKANTDINAIVDWFRERVHPDAPVNFEGVVNHYDEAGVGFTERFTERDYEKLVSSLKENLKDAEKRSQGLEARVYDFIESIMEARPHTSLGQKCGMDSEDRLAVDLKGNVMTCQNTGATSEHGIGSVFDMDNVKLTTSWHWMERPDCEGCPYLQLCAGGCMFLEDKNWVDTCNNEYHYAKGIFEGALRMLTGADVVAFEGHHTRPKAPSDNLIPVMAV
ncbi:radical SAM/SPASM domain-containing protein [Halomonas sp. S2151]|uniref:radical SAM/SPASM domain-containing protein n=1 Tax=Halomonas sp. S2151 TaxID=579478 RepID=UPI0006971B4E|nr:SPASM domain-containing protein [Halomonas sp. S2151]